VYSSRRLRSIASSRLGFGLHVPRGHAGDNSLDDEGENIGLVTSLKGNYSIKQPRMESMKTFEKKFEKNANKKACRDKNDVINFGKLNTALTTDRGRLKLNEKRLKYAVELSNLSLDEEIDPGIGEMFFQLDVLPSNT